MEGWRQRRLGSMGNNLEKEEAKKRKKKKKNDRKALTLTGLLMEGVEPSFIETPHLDWLEIRRSEDTCDK
jgi:hypothetical protein